VAVLVGMVDRYTELVNCGDGGFWNPEEDAAVIAARAVLAKVNKPQQKEGVR